MRSPDLLSRDINGCAACGPVQLSGGLCPDIFRGDSKCCDEQEEGGGRGGGRVALSVTQDDSSGK